MNLFPMFLKLEGRPCLVVGGGQVALEKITSLLHAGAHIRVVALAACKEVEELAASGRIELELRAFRETDVERQCMVVTATDSRAVNHAVFLASRQRGILCNSVDDPPNCDYYFASVVQRGKLQIAISTAGESPALAQHLRREIEAQLPEDTAAWLDALGHLRREILRTQPAGDERKALLHSLISRSLCELENCPTREFAFSNNPELERV